MSRPVGSKNKAKIVKSENTETKLQPFLDSDSKSFLAYYKQRTYQTIKTWRNALQRAEINKDRSNLQKIYEEAILDTTILAAIRYKTQQILSIDFQVYNSDGETVNEEINNIFQKSWFHNLLSDIIMCEFKGPAAFQISKIYADNQIKYDLIPRYYYRPEDGVITTSSTLGPNPADFNIRRDENLIYWTFEYLTESPNNLGLLNVLVPLFMYKKSTTQNWSGFQEIYGQPMRVLKTDNQNPLAQEIMLDKLKSMGSNASIVIDKNDILEFIAAGAGSSYEIYNELIKLLNNEIEKVILGSNNIMGNSQNVGSYNSAQNSSEEFHKFLGSSIKQIEFWVNDYFISKLYDLGIVNTTDVIFKFNQIDNLSPMQYNEIYKTLVGIVDVDLDDLSVKLGVKVNGMIEKNVNNNDGQGTV